MCFVSVSQGWLKLSWKVDERVGPCPRPFVSSLAPVPRVWAVATPPPLLLLPPLPRGLHSSTFELNLSRFQNKQKTP